MKHESQLVASCVFELFRGEVGANARNGFELVERAAGVARARARTMVGTTTPAAAASGATMKLVLSPTPPVECLSTLTPSIAERSTRLAGPHHAFGQPADLAVGHAREEDGHKKCRHLVVGYVAARVPIHQVRNLFGSEFFAVALPLDQVNCTHYETLSVPS